MDFITKILNLINEKLKTPTGALSIIFLLGIAPMGLVCWFGYQELQRKDKIIDGYESKLTEKDKKITYWQDKAFESEKNCLAKIKEMADFLDSMKAMYSKDLEVQSANMVNNKKYLNSLNNITKKLDRIEIPKS